MLLCQPYRDSEAHCLLPKQLQGRVYTQAIEIAPKSVQLTLGSPDPCAGGDLPLQSLGDSLSTRLETQGGEGGCRWRGDSRIDGQYKPLVGSLAKPPPSRGHPAMVPPFPTSLLGARLGWVPTSLPLQDPTHLSASLAAREAAAVSELSSSSSAQANCYL